MKKVITFTEEQVLQMKYMLNAVTVTGIQNAKQVSAIAQVLESGMPGEIQEVNQAVEYKNLYTPRDWETMPAPKTPI